jgi:hypothetical protein
MTYLKPEVLVLGPAIDAVQNTNGKGEGALDGPTSRTGSAYEADE